MKNNTRKYPPVKKEPKGKKRWGGVDYLGVRQLRKHTGLCHGQKTNWGFPFLRCLFTEKKTEYYEEEIERVVVEHGAKLLPGKKDINVTLLFFTGYLYKDFIYI